MNRGMDWLATAILLTLLFVTASCVAAMDKADAAPAPLPRCAVEDGSTGPRPCVWLAHKQGNGKGKSYRITKRGKIIYPKKEGKR